MGKIIGVDFGTTFSTAAVWVNNKAQLIPDSSGKFYVPSVVAVNGKQELLVGAKARDQAILNPQNTISSVKRLLGRKFDDREIQNFIKLLPYEISKASNGDIQILMADQSYSPEEIAAILLAKLKKNAEAFLKEPVTQVVISVPATFNTFQRKALIDSCKIAGLEVLRTIHESSAFSIAQYYGSSAAEVVMILNQGGGFTTSSIIEVGDGVWEAKSVGGNDSLGGNEFDQRLMNDLLEEIYKQQDIDLWKDRTALRRLEEAVEKARVDLSTVTEVEINLPCFYFKAGQPMNFSTNLPRSKLELLTKDLIEMAIKATELSLKDAYLQLRDINKVYLTGGMAGMPKIQEMMINKMGLKPQIIFNSNDMVALGSAILAGVLSGFIRNVLLMDVTPHTLSVKTVGDVITPIVERNTLLPTMRSQTFSTANDGQTQVEIQILEGEQNAAADNRTLGHFLLDGIQSAPHGVPKIKVTFNIDPNSNLNVTAQDQSTGRSQNVTVIPSSGLGDKEIEAAKSRLEAIISKI